MKSHKRKGRNYANRGASAKKHKVDDSDKSQDWETFKAPKENKLLEEYYSRQFKGFLAEDELPLLFAKMKEALPASFRVVSSHFRYKMLAKLFSSKDCVKKILDISEYLITPQELAQKEKEKKLESELKKPIEENKTIEESKKVNAPENSDPKVLQEKMDDKELAVPLKKWDFYPDDLLYEIPMSRYELKKGEGGLRKLHKFIQQCNETGLINRQEVVSMLPPLILDVKPGMKILDMCAAPGSKTSQLLEKCFGDYTQHHNLKSEATRSGVVVANDSDYSRAFMLTHQLQRFDTASLLVLNHDGQHFPKLSFGQSKYQFDRVLCDVPCSSDAAIRKIPVKWKDWGTGSGFGLHPLQLRLLTRALQLTKVGGVVCYSTCSLNPIEDEAVVHALLKAHSPAVELIDAGELLKGFKHRKGLKEWHVMIENESKDGFVEYKTFEEVPKSLHGKIRESMFCEDGKEMERLNVERCIRVLPHDQNTNGFFMAIFKKHDELSESKKPVEAPEQKQAQATIKPTVNTEEQEVPKLIKAGQFTRIDPKDPESEYIQVFFGLESFPMHLLYAINGNMKTVILVTEAVNEFLELVAKQHSKDKINITNMGVKCFERCKSKYQGSACLFRILQGAAKYLLPYMAKRTVKCSLELFKLLLEKASVQLESILEEDTREAIKKLDIGCFLLYVEVEDSNGVMVKEPIVVHKADKHINILANKQDIISLKIQLLLD
eukprot:TRINITY_DN5937_c0_g1_i9.p1 TRINITY_DN5937_c0_g1~~TRINITY_DN5937_c0_g1_i9.p1  ORF type:complete len:720 (-),score=207.82 TRINITY_DN5937_c0_g1_i9:108-2267(-)